MQLHEVISARETATPGSLIVVVDITDSDGDRYQADFGYVPGDPHGLTPAVGQWLADHPGFEVSSYVPPTEEELRALMPPLTARQLRLGLLDAGISPSTVTTTIGAMPAGPDKDKAQIEWEYATTFNRLHPLIATVGAALGLSDVKIDAMWLASVSL